MHDFSPRWIFAFLGMFSAMDAAGEVSGQQDAIIAALKLDKASSDDSLQASTTNAMRALMELAKLNVGSAISHGYKAYGQYQNSESLDNMRIRNAISTLKLSSIGSLLQEEGNRSVLLAPASEFDTSYRRLSPSFLSEGEAGRVADEFEKATGMKREAFLQQMSMVSESNIRSGDPELVSKVFSRFEGFLKKVPNEEFRNSVEKGISRLSPGMRSGVIAKALAAAAGLVAREESKPEQKAELPFGFLVDTAQAKEEISLAPEIAPLRPLVPLSGLQDLRGSELEKFGDDAIGSALKSAVDLQKNDTIFRQVSRKYRSLAPTL